MTLALDRAVVYPESDGQPMADNTEQFKWIVLLKENLECLFAQNENVLIAGDLLWYPLEGKPEIAAAPDVMAALGRPKGKRKSYRQWEENNQPPDVVFEILSPSNTFKEMTKKLKFYDHYGVAEYYIYDPERNELTGLERRDGELTVIEEMDNWVSPHLGIRFQLTAETLKVYYPDGHPFLSTVQLAELAEQEKLRAEREKLRADLAEAENQRLKALLAAAGINPGS